MLIKTPTCVRTAWECRCGQTTVVLDSPAQCIKLPLVLPSQALFPIKPTLIIGSSHPTTQGDWESEEEERPFCRQKSNLLVQEEGFLAFCTSVLQQSCYFNEGRDYEQPSPGTAGIYHVNNHQFLLFSRGDCVFSCPKAGLRVTKLFLVPKQMLPHLYSRGKLFPNRPCLAKSYCSNQLAPAHKEHTRPKAAGQLVQMLASAVEHLEPSSNRKNSLQYSPCSRVLLVSSVSSGMVSLRVQRPAQIKMSAKERLCWYPLAFDFSFTLLPAGQASVKYTAAPQWEKKKKKKSMYRSWGHWFTLAGNLDLNISQSEAKTCADHCQEGCSIPGLYRKDRQNLPCDFPQITQQRSSERSLELTWAHAVPNTLPHSP